MLFRSVSQSRYTPVIYPVGSVYTSPNTSLYPNATITTQRGTLLSELPKITNDLSTNYNTAGIKLAIYRTTDGGNTYYQVTEVANGTTSYTDIYNDTIPNIGDRALDDGTVLYTSGGVVGYDQPPISKYVTSFNNVTYWGAVVDSGQYFPNRIVQGIPSAPDAAPASFYYALS